MMKIGMRKNTQRFIQRDHMPKMIVEFYDGDVREYYSGDNDGLRAHLKGLKNVKGWEIKEVIVPIGTKHIGRQPCSNKGQDQSLI